MIIPAVKLIAFLFFVAKFIIFWLQLTEINEKARRGNPIPIPNPKKFSMLDAKLSMIKARAKNAPMNAGLHGRTIAPKKNPYVRALIVGCLLVGVLSLGINFPKSTLKINRRLKNPKIPNAIGEIIPTTFVKDFCRNVVKINPKRSMKIITPKVMSKPNKAYCLLFTLLSLEDWFAKYAKNPG